MSDFIANNPRLSDYDEVTLGNAQTFAENQYKAGLVLLGQDQVLKLLKAEAQSLMDEAFRARALGQESVGKLKEETAKYLLSLVASLPTKLRAQ
jgi:hypothetical protein